MLTYKLHDQHLFHQQIQDLRDTLADNIFVHERLFKQLDKRPVIHPGTQMEVLARLLRSEQRAHTYCHAVFQEWSASSFCEDHSFPPDPRQQIRTTQDDYVAYELMMAGLPFYDEHFRLLFPLGVCTEDVMVPQLILDGHLPLGRTPYERSLVQKGINQAAGHVLVLGLKTGYAVREIRKKDNVQHVTIVEPNADLIRYVSEHLLEQDSSLYTFVCKDPMSMWLNRSFLRSFDFIYVDLWEDVLNGFPMYLHMKERQKELNVSYQLEELFLTEIQKCLLYEVTEEDRFHIPEQEILRKKVKKFLKQTSTVITHWDELKKFVQNHDHFDRIARLKV